MNSFPSTRLRFFMVFWRLVWVVGLPIILIYLWRRGRRDPLYAKHMAERFGQYAPVSGEHVWIHAVSLGEMRSALPLTRALLDRGEQVVTTHFTPAGRRETERAFPDEVASGQLRPVWVPFDDRRAYRRFFKTFRPKYGLVMEVELWPGMIMSCHAQGVPLYQCNGQYPTRSFERDRDKWLSRVQLVPGLAGAMVKNKVQADRFRSIGQTNVAITGELRFDQAVPETQRHAADRVRPRLAGSRPVVTFASVVKGEDAAFLKAMRMALTHAEETGAPRPFFVYVPRAPERFDQTTELLENAALNTIRRSMALNDAFDPASDMSGADVLLGDSLGEMFFYLGLSDQVVVGGGFVAQGSHNIIEPLVMHKPVIVGPEIWTIEFPAYEAIEAGVCRQLSADDLGPALSQPAPQPDINGFLATHGGSVDKILAAIDAFQTGKGAA
ncbi:3-deoxy-D-manno-octulosonic acid transferase [Aliishimia ponticola]|uniref:3-deoxy-D-manno-octulosonic acid transferase n=1 Tax=Aliishimia ponticola TaxID=2499833 RepID=A0A4S4NDW2_9RHOB|nr:glycosyltransferase N-terminal domain-containing protein [Aliishimia ponticola]THH36727.1 3-deoxy-D-manno-octulosonic acid transferase [Aliishimia ponticola]